MNNLSVTKVAKLVSSIDIKLRLNSITHIYVMLMNHIIYIMKHKNITMSILIFIIIKHLNCLKVISNFIILNLIVVNWVRVFLFFFNEGDDITPYAKFKQ